MQPTVYFAISHICTCSLFFKYCACSLIDCSLLMMNLMGLFRLVTPCRGMLRHGEMSWPVWASYKGYQQQLLAQACFGLVCLPLWDCRWGSQAATELNNKPKCCKSSQRSESGKTLWKLSESLVLLSKCTDLCQEIWKNFPTTKTTPRIWTKIINVFKWKEIAFKTRHIFILDKAFQACCDKHSIRNYADNFLHKNAEEKNAFFFKTSTNLKKRRFWKRIFWQQTFQLSA